ncbi:MAG: hypothetical protein JNJ75_08575 [Cyclobacteriaceae bacterium]|nr:hypothetical protein [Cyclobacteriaceae bacterium]
MIYCIIQIVLNIVIFKIATERFLAVYKVIAFFFFPLLASIVIILSENEITVNKNNVVVLDITMISSWHFVITLSVIILIQYACNRFLPGVIRQKAN